jgi:hypothetical protein
MVFSAQADDDQSPPDRSARAGARRGRRVVPRLQGPIAFYHSVHAGRTRSPACTATTRRTARPARGSRACSSASAATCRGARCPAGAGAARLPDRGARLALARRGAEAGRLLAAQEAIPWVRSTTSPSTPLPAHVARARRLQCQTCHGPCEEMEKVYQFSSLQMGWCIDCHRGELPLSERRRRRSRSAPPSCAHRRARGRGESTCAAWRRRTRTRSRRPTASSATTRRDRARFPDEPRAGRAPEAGMLQGDRMSDGMKRRDFLKVLGAAGAAARRRRGARPARWSA